MSFSSRRTFLEQSFAAAMALAPLSQLPGLALESAAQDSHAPDRGQMPHPPVRFARELNALALPVFVDRLVLPERVRAGRRPVPITMREVRLPLHRDLPPARLWTYTAGDGRRRALAESPMAPVIEFQKNEPAAVEWIHLLPTSHLFAIDHSLHGAGRDVPDVRAVVHLHGGRTPARDDGYPEDWYVHGQSRICHYPICQDAAALWFHDHAMGINRLNIYAGLAGLALIRDEEEERLALPAGKYELPLILYDRMLTPEGELLYPQSGDPDHPWVPEFVGDALCVNGKIRPWVDVEPTLYRLRVLNAANSRFYMLNFSGNRMYQQIGSDQGLLSAPVKQTTLTLAPGERADLLVDFSESAGSRVYLQTGVQQMLEFRVAQAARRPQAAIPTALRPIARLDSTSAIATRVITLNEIVDRVQNPMTMLLNRKHWHEPVTETVRLNTTEIWEFVNLTEDTHPMHLHLVRFQILDRRNFDVFEYQNNRKLRYLAEPEPPAAHELGWKDVVQCPGGMITRIVVRFEGYSGRYLYHCHILEHEANDMMRPYDVLA